MGWSRFPLDYHGKCEKKDKQRWHQHHNGFERAASHMAQSASEVTPCARSTILDEKPIHRVSTVQLSSPLQDCGELLRGTSVQSDPRDAQCRSRR